MNRARFLNLMSVRTAHTNKEQRTQNSETTIGSRLTLRVPVLGSRLDSSALVFVLALLVYFGATLPYLGNFPLIGQDEPWIAAPAAKLATQGVYGDDLFAGYYSMELRTYNFPPLFPMTEALAFRLLGVSAWTARLVAVLFGAATLALTYLLGRRLYGGSVGALAAVLLVGLRLTAERDASGIPLLDLARIARYDIAVPPLLLATLLCFVWAEMGNRSQEAGVRSQEAGDPITRASLRHFQCSMFNVRFFLTGVLAGLAALAHVYGGFVLMVLGALLLWREGWRLWRRPAPYLIAIGCALAMLPWVLYVASDLSVYAGQMRPEQTRFHLWEPMFYVTSLLAEPARYRRLFFDGSALVLWPRVGIWVALLGLPLASLLLLRRTLGLNRAQDWPAQTADRLLLLALPVLALLLALLVNLKFYNYILPLLPFVALNLAWLATRLWQPSGVVARVALGVLLALVLAEGAVGITQGLRIAATTSDYQAYTQQVAAVMPPGSRVLALHQFWFGVYPQQYVYRSIALSTYLADPSFYPLASNTVEQTIEQIAPQYVLIDRFVAPDLHFDRAPAAIVDARWRSFREYLEHHCAQPIAQINNRDYGELTILKVCP